jgi:crotonobetainyl-CoA:carnitine CoA-transferase CaiB-like acyl-CoA transferase
VSERDSTQRMSEQPLPLQGITVVDLSRFVSGPLCTFFLASLGAEVLAVEDVTPSPSRRLPPFAHPDGGSTSEPVDGALSVPFLKRGRGKRSIAIALGTDEGATLVRRLASTADVLVENARPGAMAASFGLGYDDLASRNPGLVYCSISGYGHDGPATERPAMDMAVQAASGLMAKTGFADGPPLRAGIAIADHVAASFAALGIVSALRQRDRTGHGQHVDLAMLDVLTALVWDEPVDHYAAVGMPVRTGNADPRGAPINAYECADGWVAVTLSSDQQWRGLCETMGRLDLFEQLPTVRERARHAADVDDAVGAWAAPRTADDVEQAFLDLGIAAARVRDPVAAADDPHLGARGLLEPLYHPAAGGKESGYLGPRLPIAFAGRAEQLPPTEQLGASTDAVLRAAGIDDAQLASLRERGIVA